MNEDEIGYPVLIQNALRHVVHDALQRAAGADGLPGEHHFYVTFLTGADGVDIPERLVEEYPDEMTIVIKRHFWDLEVGPTSFSIGLSFSGKPETLTLPYAAITRFVDPSVPFGLELQSPPTPAEMLSDDDAAASEDSSTPDGVAGQVLSLDAFRKK